MKFVCDSCNTKYSIADDRVHGRVLKIRCKTCDHVITVREEMKATPAASIAEALGRNLESGGEEHTVVSMPPPSSPSAEQADEWYVSFDGEQEGPMPLVRALDRVRTERPKGREAHTWRPGFFVWLPVEEVPEFAPAIDRVRKATPPPVPARPSRPMATVKSPSGSQPALRSGTGPQPVVKSPTGSQPVAKSPTGSQPVAKSPAGSQPVQKPASLLPDVARPAGGMPALANAPDPLPPVDSRPVPLPPPPEPLKDAPLNLPLPPIPAPLPSTESIPSGPMAVQVTRPEPRIARRALEEDKPEPKKPEERKPEPLIPPSREPSAPEVSPFVAALAAATGQEPKQHDTGPVPLPPPPGDPDLAISEPSGLLSISHLAAQAPSLSRSSDKQVIDTFGGVAVTPPGSNGTASAAPVVVVTGPAQSAAAWVKWSVAALLLLVVALGGTVVYLVTRRPVPSAPQEVVETNRKLDDKPIQFADPAPPTSIGPATADPKKPAPVAPTKHTNPGPTKVGAATPKLSDEQKKLAALYGDSSEKGSPKETAVVDRGERTNTGGQVSQASILAVVTQNRRALNLCYDRVLKHDSTLKRARLVTHVKVGLSGAVKDVSVPDPEYANSEIGQCLTQTIKRWHFPAADAEYETEFPIILQAE